MILSRIAGVKDLEEAVQEADFVIEAVAEDITLKKEIFSVVDGICREETIISTNTSGLSITELASATGRSEKVVGTHFWNPPHLIPLVEIVRGERTSEEWIPIFNKHKLVWAHVHTMKSAAEDPQTVANQFVVEVEHPELGKIKMVNSPVKFSETPTIVRIPPPLLGQHTEEVLVDLGYDWDFILKCKDEGVIL